MPALKLGIALPRARGGLLYPRQGGIDSGQSSLGCIPVHVWPISA